MIVIVMGVSGVGKTTVGRKLAARLGWEFLDADDFHTAANIEKIKQALPLEDEDREPWLKAIHEELARRSAEKSAEKQNTVLACSALKREYREKLQVNSDVRFIYLKGTYSVIAERLRSRQGHFAGERVLASQFSTLQEPEDAIVVDADSPVDNVIAEICVQMGL